MPARRFPVPAVLLASLFICSNAAAQQTMALQSPPSLPAVSTPTVPTLELDHTHEAATSTRHEHDEEAGDPDTDPDAREEDEHHTAVLGLGCGPACGRPCRSSPRFRRGSGAIVPAARGGSDRDVYLGFNMSRKF